MNLKLLLSLMMITILFGITSSIDVIESSSATHAIRGMGSKSGSYKASDKDSDSDTSTDSGRETPETNDNDRSSTIDDCEHQQVHLSTATSCDMTIVWNTIKDTNDSQVWFGKSRENLNQIVSGFSTEFVDKGPEKRSQWVHEVTVSNLAADTVYYYQVGSKYCTRSDVFSFKTWPAGDSWSPHVIVYGDLGTKNASSLPALKQDISTNQYAYDAIFHLGNIAYNLDLDNGKVGDAFMCKIQPLASTLPYMTCPGNFDTKYNFLHYKKRFHMPGDEHERMYYSIKMGPARIIFTNTELEGIFAARQFFWLEEELKEANRPENRATQPWVIIVGHRPLYSSNKNNEDGTRVGGLVRKSLLTVLNWEDLFVKYGVDVAMWAHEHSYERLWPVYKRKVMNGSMEHPYTNPKAPIHIITGPAGAVTKDTFDKNDVEDWSALRSLGYGYCRLKVFNSSHLNIQYVSAEKDGNVVDDIMVIKDSHGPYKLEEKSLGRKFFESVSKHAQNFLNFIGTKTKSLYTKKR